MVGRRRRRQGSRRLKHLKAQRGLPLPFGSSGNDDDFENDDHDENSDKADKAWNDHVEMCSLVFKSKKFIN